MIIDSVDVSGCRAYVSGWCTNYYINRCCGTICPYKYTLLEKELATEKMKNQKLEKEVINNIIRR